MGKIVQINAGFTSVYFSGPDRRYDAGASLTLTDAEYAALDAATARAVTLTQSGVTDPIRPNPTAPTSLGDLLQKSSNLSDLSSSIAARANLSLDINAKTYGAKGDGTTDDSAAIQAAINACGTAGGGIVRLSSGSYVVNTSLTFPIGKKILLQGAGEGGASYTTATQLKRTSGTNPVISAVGTSSSNRISIELRDLEVHGGSLAGDLVLIQRGSHVRISNVHISYSAGTALHCTELWDSSFDRLIIETSGNSTTSPALLFDSVVSGGSSANNATIHITNSIFQGNTGTDIRLTGSTADGSPSNEIQFVNCKMESAGATGTYPFIDLDYAQSCSWVNTKILVSASRTPTAVIQQTNTVGNSIGSRANRFIGCTFDASAVATNTIDLAVGAFEIVGCRFVGTAPSGNSVRIQSTVNAGYVTLIGPVSAGVLDQRTADERLGARADNASLIGSDLLLYRSAAKTLKISDAAGAANASVAIAGNSDSQVGGATASLMLTTPAGAAGDSSYATFNARARFGYDGGLGGPVIDDGNSGSNKPLNFRTTGANRLIIDTSGNVAAQTVGAGLRVKEGSNAKQGTAVLVAGSVVVANTSVTANSRIIITSQVDGGTPGFLRVSTRSAGTSFTITSSSGTDTSTVAYQIFEPA